MNPSASRATGRRVLVLGRALSLLAIASLATSFVTFGAAPVAATEPAGIVSVEFAMAAAEGESWLSVPIAILLTLFLGALVAIAFVTAKVRIDRRS